MSCLRRRKWGSAAQAALELCKCLERRMWSDVHPLRQFEGLLSQELLYKVREHYAPQQHPPAHNRYFRVWGHSRWREGSV